MRGLSGGAQCHTAWRGLSLIVIGTTLVLTSEAGAYPGLSMPRPAAVYQSARPAVLLFGSGTLTAPNSTSKAITYNRALAPIGAALTAAFVPWSEQATRAEFTVFGLLPNRGYAVLAHTKACGVTPDAAGPQFQIRIDPAATSQSPLSNPQYANPNNGIWLDLRTDAAGLGTSHTIVPFNLTGRVPGSIVVHEAKQTPTDSDQAANAGARIACLTLSRR